MAKWRKSSTRGYTLIELVISNSLSTLLMVGVASVMLIVSHALDGAGAAHDRNEAAEIVADVLRDLELAKNFTELTSTAVTFTVPDRDGDTFLETIRYSWSGIAGDPLLMEYNGSTPSVYAENVQSFNLDFLQRTIGQGNSQVVFQEYSETKQGTSSTSVTVTAPSGTLDGDLMIAAVATDDNTAASLWGPAGWTPIEINHQDGLVTLGVWWKVAASEPGSYQFTWTGSQKAYAWIMRFTGQDDSFPINVWTSQGGKSISPTSPAVFTSVDAALILRIGGFDYRNVTSGVPGLSGHTAITMEPSNNSSGPASGGAGYVEQPTAGNSGTSTFALTKSQEYRTVTIAIAPQTCN